MNVLRNRTILVAFYSTFETFSDFEIIQDFFRKPIYFFLRKTKLWTFTEILLFQSHSTDTLLKFDEENIWTREQPMLGRLGELNWQTSG